MLLMTEVASAEPVGPAPAPMPTPTAPAAATDKSTGMTTGTLGEPWVVRRIDVVPDEVAAPGTDHAALVYQCGAVSTAQGASCHDRAALYLHGRNNYFFQTHLADAFLSADHEFYTLDLRACG